MSAASFANCLKSFCSNLCVSEPRAQESAADSPLREIFPAAHLYTSDRGGPSPSVMSTDTNEGSTCGSDSPDADFFMEASLTFSVQEVSPVSNLALSILGQPNEDDAPFLSKRSHSPATTPKPKKSRKKRLGITVDRSHEGAIAAAASASSSQTQSILSATMRDDGNPSERLAIVLDGMGEPIGDLLGTGASGIVYRLGLNKVLKIYKHQDLVGRSAFTKGREGEAAALGLPLSSLTAIKIFAWDSHTSKVVVADQPHELRPDHQHLAVVLPLVPNHRELEDFAGKLAFPEFLRLAISFIHQLQELHMHGILHGDLKPQNVLLTDSGVLQIADFGLARCLRGAPHLPTRQEGTIAYQAPEVKRGSYAKESDLWTLGVMLYKMYTGNLPFSDDFWDTYGANRDRIVFPPSMPAELKSLIYDLFHRKCSLRPGLEDCLRRLQPLSFKHI